MDSPDPTRVRMAEDAIERNLQIIGEATKHLPSEVTEEHSEIPWAQIRGFRNILVHEYFGVETEVVRDVVETYLPSLAFVLSNEAQGWAPNITALSGRTPTEATAERETGATPKRGARSGGSASDPGTLAVLAISTQTDSSGGRSTVHKSVQSRCVTTQFDAATA